MDKNVLYQIDIREWLENSFGSEVMIPVYGSKKDERYDVFLQSYLVPIKNAEKQLETNTWIGYNKLDSFFKELLK